MEEIRRLEKDIADKTKEDLRDKNLSEEELKKEFIEEFGIDKWIEMEAEVPCDMLAMKLCDYL